MTRDTLCTSEVPVGGRWRKTPGQSANRDISCACFIRWEEAQKLNVPLATRLYTSQNSKLWGTKGRTCIFAGWHQKYCFGALTSLSHNQSRTKNLQKCRPCEQQRRFYLLEYKPRLLCELNHLLPGKKAVLFHRFQSSGKILHLATNRWRTNMPITNSDMPRCLLGNLALNDCTLKSESDTSERVI